jgi:hypothetical protein
MLSAKISQEDQQGDTLCNLLRDVSPVIGAVRDHIQPPSGLPVEHDGYSETSAHECAYAFLQGIWLAIKLILQQNATIAGEWYDHGPDAHLDPVLVRQSYHEIREKLMAMEPMESRRFNSMIWIESRAAIKGLRDGSTQVAAVPDQPRKLLVGWHSICEALGEKYSTRKEIKGLNDRLDGPIANKGQGTSPRVYRDDLIEWWNRLALKHKEDSNQTKGRKLSADAQYNYGTEGTVAPEVGGSVKKRRSDRHDET